MKHQTGALAIEERGPLFEGLVVYPAGPRLKTRDGIEAVPFLTFSQMLAADKLWP